MSYIGTEPKDVRSFSRAKFDYTASQGQTAFTGADDDGKTLAFRDGQIEVHVNGILMDESDFSTSNGNTVTLASAANLNDIINITSLQTDIPNSDYVPASGGTFTGDVDFGSNKITYANLYNNLSDLPSASTYHGMFAHVHNTGLAYYSHAGAWIPLANLTGATFSGDITLSEADTPTITLTDTTNTLSTVLQSGNSTAVLGTTTNHDLRLFANNTEHMRITAAGQITKPNQPAFAACTVSSKTLSANSYTRINNFTNVRINAGSHFDTSTGTFTAPIAGNYWFGFQILLRDVGNSDNSIHVGFYKNGSIYSYGNIRAPGGSANAANATGYGAYLPVIGTLFLPLSANDYVAIHGYSSGTIGVHGSTTWSHFFGYLVN